MAPCPSTALISRPPGLDCWGPKVPTHPGLRPGGRTPCYRTLLEFSQPWPPPRQTDLAVPSVEGPSPMPSATSLSLHPNFPTSLIFLSAYP